jgi:hypothetical protein
MTSASGRRALVRLGCKTSQTPAKPPTSPGALTSSSSLRFTEREWIAIGDVPDRLPRGVLLSAQ